MTDQPGRTLLQDPWWRLNNLYFIKDKAGEKVRFKWNWAQKELYDNMWYKNCILKARQLGMTTAIQIFMLDRALFNDDMNCGIVAHNKEDAETFFADKIKYAYEHLPEDLKKARKATSDTARSLRFSNGSHIRVGTSMRSGTYQYIHVSEFGKMCAKYPDKAEEVITGTLNTVGADQLVFIESTAEGPFGEFYEMCRTAEMLKAAVDAGEATLSLMDYRFFFYPWFKHPDYALDEKVEIPPKMGAYFKELREEHGIDLPPERKAWYVKKKREQGTKMKQEFPATPEEAFERGTELAILGKQLKTAQQERRITRVPLTRGVPINTFWDIGRNDVTAIWFHQLIDGVRDHFIYYTEDRLEDLTFYAELLLELKKEYKWFYGKHYLPHDIETTDISSIGQLTRRQILEGAGVTPIVVVPRTPNLTDSIEVLRKKMSTAYFDAEGCAPGLKALHGYEWKYDELLKTTRSTPADNRWRNGADALRQWAQGYRGEGGGFGAHQQRAGVAAGGGRKYALKRGVRGTLTNPTTDHIV